MRTHSRMGLKCWIVRPSSEVPKMLLPARVTRFAPDVSESRNRLLTPTSCLTPTGCRHTPIERQPQSAATRRGSQVHSHQAVRRLCEYHLELLHRNLPVSIGIDVIQDRAAVVFADLLAALRERGLKLCQLKVAVARAVERLEQGDRLRVRRHLRRSAAEGTAGMIGGPLQDHLPTGGGTR
jgi:hypothetical protein